MPVDESIKTYESTLSFGDKAFTAVMFAIDNNEDSKIKSSFFNVSPRRYFIIDSISNNFNKKNTIAIKYFKNSS
jgi:hypothetical protein